MTLCFFVSDLHGRLDRYRKLFRAIGSERPEAVFLGGDLLPSGAAGGPPMEGDFIGGHLAVECERIRSALGEGYPEIFVILGNDDGRDAEGSLLEGEARGLWHYAHNRRLRLGGHDVYGYACVPPTPFLLKDWERYDVSRHVDPGACSPEEGWRTVEVPAEEVRYGTIGRDLELLAGNEDLSRAIFLFHSPPYQTCLDRAALDGRQFEHVPLDLHVGSIAIRRFLEVRGPLLSLHGHVHESARLTGAWRERIGRTHAFSAAHDGPELALVRFSPEDPGAARRELV